jgi:hypothetical protein
MNAMKIARAALLVLSVVPAALAFGYSSDAAACGMSVRLDITPQRPSPVQEIARAEKALESGQNLQAARAVLGTFPRIRVATAGDSPLETRALRVFALALVRSDGTADEKRARVATKDAWTPSANLAWALQAIQEIDEKRPNDPTVQADLGEAMSKLPHEQSKALAILQRLAQKDLMGSPHAYAALARLRSEKGDMGGAEAAVKRCEEMSKVKGVCRPPSPSAPSTKPAVAAKA